MPEYTVVDEGGEWGVALNGRTVISGMESKGEAEELVKMLNEERGEI